MKNRWQVTAVMAMERRGEEEVEERTIIYCLLTAVMIICDVLGLNSYRQ